MANIDASLLTSKFLYFSADSSFEAKKSIIDSSNPESISFLPQSNSIYANKHLFKAEDPSNKVTSLNAESSDIQYPSAKCVYDVIIENEEVVAAAINDLSINKANKTDILYLKEVTYSTLKTLRDSSGLIPGQQYRITDYNTTVTGNNYTVGNHQFDVIVVADSSNKLNEVARAIQHSGDTYFSNCKLESWELKYCLDNDTNRFEWANTSTGKGVIYYMKDEFRNECPYDFKNIMFYRKWNSTKSLWCDIATSSTSGAKACYTFSSGGGSSTTSFTDYSLSKSNYIYNNVIKDYKSSNKLNLNNNCFFGNSCYSNTFGNGCNYNTFGNGCNYNTFGNSCYYNTFGNSCYYNTFGNSCSSNTFGTDCYYNTFGNSCYSNTFGTDCYSNTFGNGCSSNTFGNSCSSNTFGNSCEYNIFGNSCSSNTFGNSCKLIFINPSSKKCNIRSGVSSINLKGKPHIPVNNVFRNFSIVDCWDRNYLYLVFDDTDGNHFSDYFYFIDDFYNLYKWTSYNYGDIYTESDSYPSIIGDSYMLSSDASGGLTNYNIESVIHGDPAYYTEIYQTDYVNFNIHSINANNIVVSFTDEGGEGTQHSNITFNSAGKTEGVYMWTNDNFWAIYTDSNSSTNCSIGDNYYSEALGGYEQVDIIDLSGNPYVTTVARKSNGKMVQYCEADLIADQN